MSKFSSLIYVNGNVWDYEKNFLKELTSLGSGSFLPFPVPAIWSGDVMAGVPVTMK